MQVLAPRAEVSERALAGPDAVGDAADSGERAGKGDPAGQGGALTLVQVLAQDAPKPRK